MYVRYDLKMGLIREFYKVLAVAVITLAACIWFDNLFRTDIAAGVVNQSDSIINLYAFVLKGGYPKSIDINKIFELPVLWILFETYLLFILGKYPFGDMNNNHGISVLLRGNSRKRWYVSKCVWSVVVVILYHLVTYGTILIFGLVRGYKLTVDFVLPLDEIAVEAYIIPRDIISSSNLLILFIVPVVAAVAIACFQLMVSTFSSSTTGFVCSVIILVSSAFYMNKYLIGNMTMWLRSDLFDSGEINFESSISLCLVVSIVCIVVGMIGFNNKDILIKDN